MPEWPRRISEEMRQHLDDEYATLRPQGIGHDAATRRLAPTAIDPVITLRAE